MDMTKITVGNKRYFVLNDYKNYMKKSTSPIILLLSLINQQFIFGKPELWFS
jgi:hypothetical protein